MAGFGQLGVARQWKLHCEHAHGAGLVFESHDAVGNSFQVARQVNPNVADIPGRRTEKTGSE